LVDNNRYLELLESRIIELLPELEDDDERRAMMRELGNAAEDGGITAFGWSPHPNLEKPWQWAADLLSTSDRAVNVIGQKRVDEGWPHPRNFESLDEIVSAFRPRHSLD
jgi:hypothetical protein